MQIQTLTGASIQDALAEARATLGDSVVLLESVAAADGRPAQITVMLDAARATAPARAAAVPAGAAPEAEAPAAPLGYGYGAARRPLFTTPTPGAAPAPRPAPPPAPAPTGPDPTLLARLDRLDARLAGMDAITDRLDKLERQLHHAVHAGAPAWAAHPLYGRLLGSGLSQAMTTALLAGADERGLTPDRTGPDDQMALLWSVAQSLRDWLNPTAPPRYAADTLVAIGPGGSGKTTLLRRLAADARFYGRREVGVLIVAPPGAPAAADPGAAYRQDGLAARVVRTAAETREALELFHGAGALLVDTPALPTGEAEARQALADLAEVLAPLAAFDVVLTLDAARARPPLDLRGLDALPLAPTMGALTRLDEAEDWGRIAEWLVAFDRPVGFASTAAGAGDALAPYSPAWFVELFANRLSAPLSH